mgnify:CR=1 FL=1
MGYTDGVAQRMSEKSLKGELFESDQFTYQDDNFNPDELDAESLSDFLDQKLDIDHNGCIELLRDGYTYDNEDNKVELYYNADDDGFTVIAYEDILDWIDENSQGGLFYILDEQKELVGARLGVCGEHIGSVSVWLDTQKGVFEQGGRTYSISDEDRETLNDSLDMLLND